MAAVTVAAVAKKVAAALVSNKKGRKFIGYVIGISIFILCIPLIAVLCLFGWTSGNPSIDYQSGAAAGVADMFNDPALQERFENIQIVFTEYDLSTGDIHKAQFMSIKKLAGLEEQENFYERLASCFLETTNEKTVYMLIEEAFEIEIADEDEARLDELYGVTPVRKASEGG
jgi:hypothetical protein